MFALSAAASLGLPTAAGQPDQSSPGNNYMREITPAVLPVDDGYLSCLFIRSGRVYSFVSGTGQACWDGWLRACDVGGSDVEMIASLGFNSLLSKGGLHHESPRLVGVLSPTRFIFNVTCEATFPAGDAQNRGATGNIVIYDTSNNTFHNITKLSGKSNRFAHALDWFPREGMLLVEIGGIGSSASPSMKQGTERPVCLRLDGTIVPIEKHPRIALVCDRLSRIKTDMIDAPLRGWTMSIGWRDAAVPMLTTPPTTRGFFSTVLDGPRAIMLVGHPELGTWLLDDTGNIHLRITDALAVSYDRQKRTIAVRSRERDRNGQFRYWTVNVEAYLSWLPSHVRPTVKRAGASDGYIREITHAVAPIDGYLTSVLVRDGRLYSFAVGEGKTAGDGWLRVTDVEDDERIEVAHLGAHGPLVAGKGGDEPRLVAMRPRLHDFILNLRCDARFPNSNSYASRGSTGNIVVYNSARETFRNLTEFSYADNCFVRAIEWFPGNGVLLAEVSEINKSHARATPVPGTQRPICLRFDGTREPIEKYPRIKRFYERLSRIEIRLVGSPGVQPNWRHAIGWRDDAKPLLVAPPGATGFTLATVLDTDRPIMLVGHDELGTWLFDDTGQIHMRISDAAAFCFDRQTQTVAVRSTVPDSNGQYRYWTIDLAAYMDWLGASIQNDEGQDQ